MNPEEPLAAARRAAGKVLGSEAFWLLVAVVLRVGFVLCLGDRYYQADEWGYDTVARSLAEHGVYGVGGSPAVGAPGTGLFISLFYLLGHSLRAGRLGLALLSSFTAWLIGRMTADLSGSRKAGIAALAVAAVYPFFVYYSGLLLSETVYLALTVPALWLLCAGLRERGSRLGPLAGAGVLLAAAGLTRAEAVPIAAVLWLALAALCAAGRLRPAAWALGCALWALPLGGWMARNKTLCGSAVLDLHGGMTLLHGTLLFDANEVDTGEAQKRFETLPLYAEGSKLDDLRRDRLYKAAAVDFMRRNPGTVARQWAVKFVNFWRLYPRRDKAYADTPGMKPNLGLSHGTLAVVSLLFEPVLLGLGFWGAWRARRRFAELFPLYWMVLATCGVHVIVVSQMRYRLALMPIFILFSCAALFPAQRSRPN